MGNNYEISGFKREKHVVDWNTSKNERVAATWTLTPNWNWTRGTAGVELHYTIVKPPPNADETITSNWFTVIYPYIENAEWQGPSAGEGGEKGGEGGADSGGGDVDTDDGGGGSGGTMDLPWTWIGGGVGVLLIVLWGLVFLMRR